MSDGIRAWLASHGLERLAELLIENEVDIEALPELDESHLKELGIPLGPRVKLLKAIAGLRAAPEALEPAVVEQTPASVTAPHPREAERRQLTVMFVDLVGSTALSQRLDPEEMRDVLRTYQNTVAGEISRLDGFTAKLMGDGVLAYFGWPRTHEDEPERAVRSGLAIVAAVAKLSGGGEKMAARVGIATGLVVVGDLVGEGAAQEQAVVGDTPNLAARLQGLAEPGTVVIAEATHRLLGDLFELRELGAQSLKGIAEPVPAFAVLGERVLESRFAARAGRTVLPMVGRDEELALLLRHWRQAVSGEAQAVMLVGEAGIGKSRLIRALREAVLPDGATVLLYQCSPFHSDSPLWPVTQQLAFASRFEPDDDATVKQAKLSALLGEEGEALALLAGLLGIPAAPDPLADLTPQERRRRTLQALVDQLLTLARNAPVLVLFEDVHWLDPTSSELLQRILSAIDRAGVLLMMTSRPAGEPQLGNFPHFSRLALQRLGRKAADAIVSQVAAVQSLSDETRQAILDRTDGVPLFVEELTKSVLDAAPVGSGVTVPATLQDSLLARLDRDPAMKAVAQIAACIGREFRHALLQAVAELPPAELGSGLDALVRAELLFRRGIPPNASYTFKHALVRDTAHESLLKSRRRAIHGRIATVLDSSDGGSPPEIVALHYTEADRVEPALDSWERAGRAAIERSAPREAAAHFSKAIALLDRLPGGSDRLGRELRLQAALGGALVTVRGFGATETMRAFERAYTLARQSGETVQLFAILMGRFFGSLAHDIMALGTIAEEMQAAAKLSNDHLDLLMAERASGTAAMYAGRLEATRKHFRRMLDLYRIEDHRTLVQAYIFDPSVIALTMLGLTETTLGFAARGAALHQDGVEQARRLAHPLSLAFAMHYSCMMGITAGDPAMILRSTDALFPMCEQMGLPVFFGIGLITRGWAVAMGGDLDAGIASVERGIAFNREAEMELFAGRWLAVLAELQSCAGRPAEARETADQAIRTVQRVGDRWTESEIHRVRGEIERNHGEPGDAETHIGRALTVARAQGARLFELRAATSIARLWTAQGERSKALDLLAPIYAWFTKGLDTPDLIETRALLEQLR